MNLRKFLTSGFLAHWQLIGLTLLLGLLCIQQLRVTGLKSSLSAEKAAHATTIVNYRQAQADAMAKALAAKFETEKRYEAEREKADARAADLGQQYRASVLRFQAAQRAASGEHLRQPAGSTQIHEGASESPGLFISTDDALICGENTAKAEAAAEWAHQISEND